MMRKFLFLLVAHSLLAACTNGPAPNTKKKLTISDIPKGTTH